MSIKSRLFASVAAPVLSLPLLIQPVMAMPLGLDVAPAGMAQPGLIRVQQQVIPQDEQPGKGKERQKRDEKQRDDKQQGGERPQAEGRGKGGDQTGGQGGDEQPKRRQQQADQAPQQREAPKQDAQQAGEPQRKPKPADQAGEAQPKSRQQNAEQAPDAKPAKKQDAQQAEQPQQAPKPARQQADQSGTAQPAKPARQADQAEEPLQKPRQQNAEQAPDAKPAKKQDAQQAEQPQQAPKPPRQQADQGTGNQPVSPARQADQAQQPQRKPHPGDQTGEPQQKPRQQNADGAPDAKPPRKPDAQQGQMQPDQAQPGQTQPGKAPASQQAGQGSDQQLNNGRPGQPPQTAKTPEQVERAKEIAKDPKAAKPGETAVLPVENGAAVLDSAKQPNRRPSADGRNQPGQSDQQAGQQGRPSRNPVADQPAGPPPRSDADAQGPGMSRQQEQQAVRDADKERGQRLDKRPKFERPKGWEVLGAAALGAAVGYAVGQGQQGNPPPQPGYADRDDGRVFMRIDDQEVIRHDDSRRFYDDRRPPEYDQLSQGRVREVIMRDDGTRIVTIRNRYGEIVQRSRVAPDGREYVLYYAPQLVNETRGPDYVWRDPGDDLPPMRLQVPLDDYIADTSAEPNRDYYRFLEQPPVERVERVYSLDEVRYSARLRDKVRRIDLDTITFDTGSADISMNQAGTLRNVAEGIKQVLGKDPSETFLIEGHTDAVGSDQDNLVLSDQRAESVARVLTDVYGIPPENMATQGYGEQFLKVQTAGPNQENRRVTIRRITPLVKPVASNQ
ncbi:OmpA family protein [Neorhizobium sp. NCHU2750]|uniref:OmpA family protein n=1 Tax=Neorhizobium sp. NCHU2750 TaxID=1825976 RepID=UPI000E76F4C4